MAEVFVSPDGLEARLRGAHSRDDALAALEDAGVVFGLDEAALEAALAHGDGVVARGSPPIPGADAHVELLCLDPTAFTAVEDEHGAVDLRGGHLLQPVHVDQVLARKVPAGAGEPGRTVTGELIPATPGADKVKLTPGEGATLDAARTEVLARREGLPRIKGDVVSVIPGFTVKEVNLQTGDVHFAGSVVVEGDVIHGFTVHATGDVQIKGNVEGGKVLAGGKVTVRGGVRHGEIEAYGDVAVRFVDPQSTIKSRGTIEVRESALQSGLTARRIVVGRQLAAGTATAWERIEAQVLGNVGEMPTNLTIEAEPSLTDLQRELVRKQIVEVEHELERLRRSEAAAGHDARVLKPLVLKEVATELRRLSLAQKLSVEPSSAPGTVVARREVHRGVTVHLHKHARTITTHLGAASFRLEGDQVVG